MRDAQKTKVYNWERATTRAFGIGIYRPSMSREAVEQFVQLVWEKEYEAHGARKAPPKLKFWGRERNRATAGLDHTLTLPSWALNPWLVCHELAHRLDGKHMDYEPHGPKFVAILIGLLSRHGGLCRAHLLESARIDKIRVSDHWLGGPPAPPRLKHLVHAHLPGTPTQIAVRINAVSEFKVDFMMVVGASTHLIRNRQARWRGNTLVKA